MQYNTRIFGVRKETLLRLEKLYGQEYFNDRHRQGNSDYHTGEQMREKMYLQEFERIKEYINGVDKGKTVLDIGSGRGEFLSLFNNKWKKYGIEISDHAANIARKKGIIVNEEPKDNFFDIIIFRGTIQHIPDPIYKISECYYWLKPGGSIIFLATPNTHSLVYRLFKNLPMIDEQLNFLLPSDKILRQTLSNFGFKDIRFEYPYIGTPYANPAKDILSFILRLVGIKRKTNFPFFKNMLECYAKK